MTKTAPKQTKVTKPTKTRKLSSPKYESFRLQKPIKSDTPALPSAFAVLKRSLTILVKNWKPFLGISIVYGVLNLILVQSFSVLNLPAAKEMLEHALAGQWNQFVGGLSIFSYLVGSTGDTNSEVAGVYQFILLVIVSLAVIWTLRQAWSSKITRIRDGFYDGMHPLIPFLAVFAVMTLQVVPLAIGVFLYGLLGPAGGITSSVEGLAWMVLLFLLVVLTLYMLCSSLFALYIVCLPGMRPIHALRSARELVRYRRWTVLRKILFLPLVLLVSGALLLVPIILFVTPIAIVAYFLMTILITPLVHSYMYAMYRELLD